MVAVEFEAYAKDGIIKIPDEYKDIAEGELKIIILKQEQKSGSAETRQQKISDMKKLLSQIKSQNIFRTIDDPVEWQKSKRDEWT